MWEPTQQKGIISKLVQAFCINVYLLMYNKFTIANNQTEFEFSGQTCAMLLNQKTRTIKE